MKISTYLLLMTALFSPTVMALEVNITREVAQFTVRHGDKEIVIARTQDTGATLVADFALTSRPCPPFCAQPLLAAPGVETIAEVELVTFMQQQLADGSGLLIDARTDDWYRRGTIPGSINIPFTKLHPGQGADELTLEDSLLQLGVTPKGEGWDFSQARQLVLWCNGPWCGQSPTAIRGLLSIGYPAEKLFYYRGGMQLWKVFGLPVVTPNGELVEDW